MVKEDIIRGLEGAMSKGETLERAMYSFYNAGYNKQDVEEAARALSTHLSTQSSMVPTKLVLPSPNLLQKQMQEIPSQKQTIPLDELKPKKSLQSLDQLHSLENQIENQNKKPEVKVVQEVSKYEQKPKTNTRTILIVILSILLAVLLGSLVGIFIFKDTLIKIFNSFF